MVGLEPRMLSISCPLHALQSILDPQLRARCYDWVRDHWKLILVAVVAALFVLVSYWHQGCAINSNTTVVFNLFMQVVMVAIVLGVCLEDERSTCSRR